MTEKDWTHGLARSLAKAGVPDLDEATANVQAKRSPCVATIRVDRIVVVRFGTDDVSVYLADVKSPMWPGDQPLSMKFESPIGETAAFLARHFPGVPVELIDVRAMQKASRTDVDDCANCAEIENRIKPGQEIWCDVCDATHLREVVRDV